MHVRSREVLLGFLLLLMSSRSFAQLRISVSFGPPALPVYEQPLCPGDGYIWTPGYWAWSGDANDYYWVPGTWVLPPEAELLWTPPYWAWVGDAFVFYDGYWGPRVGFYGGVDYGFGYFGDGYVGGRWDHGHFFYNRSVNNVNVTVIHNVYNTTVINTNKRANRISYNGGNGGLRVRPTAEQEAAARERHVPPPAAQRQQMEEARTNNAFRASANHGKPPVAATARPGDFGGREALPAREAGGPYPPANREADRPRTDNATRTTFRHPNELPPMDRTSPPNTGNAKLDQKYQKEQGKLQKQQEQERQKLQNQQEKEHQQLAKRSADEARKQQTEQRHQQQTEQLHQRQMQQQQKMQQRQVPALRQEGPKK